MKRWPRMAAVLLVAGISDALLCVRNSPIERRPVTPDPSADTSE